MKKNLYMFLIVSVITICTLFLNSNTYINLNAESDNYYAMSIDQNNNIEYIYIDNNNFNSVSTNYFNPDGGCSEDFSSFQYSTYSIHDYDTRVKVLENQYTLFPYRAVCFIEVFFDIDGDNVSDVKDYGTGAMVGPSAVISSSHLLYNSDYGWPTQVNIMPGGHFNDSNVLVKPYGTIGVSKLTVGNYHSTGSPNDDWSIIDLNSNIGNTTGYFGLSSTAITNGNQVRLYGYNIDKGTREISEDVYETYDFYKKMTYSIGTVSGIETYKFYHNCDNKKYSDGGPLTYGTTTIVGINSGVSSLGDSACKISTYIVGWINERLEEAL